ncbi:apolipoprotein C-II-like [Hyla sarda]|uniref:apolipoprotein C-II-like n=1 Tax=Hyla sarda TaxID=327740 RepID=UPI0024C367AD|nr:apolipoprotein C-II-like [Hyla sarda]
MRTQLLAISLILLLISTGIESYRIQKRETSTYLSQASDVLNSAWEQVRGKTQELIEKAKSTGVEDKIKEYYDKGTSAVSTYFNVLSDQAYHWWHGN